MSIPSTRTHMDGVLTALSGASVTAYQVEAPASATAPYAFAVWTGGWLHGPVGDPDDDGELVVQVTYVGEGPEQADGLRDLGRAALIGTSTLTVTGRNVWRVTLDVTQPSQRDSKVEPPVFYAVDRYRIFTTPSGG